MNVKGKKELHVERMLNVPDPSWHIHSFVQCEGFPFFSVIPVMGESLSAAVDVERRGREGKSRSCNKPNWHVVKEMKAEEEKDPSELIANEFLG